MKRFIIVRGIPASGKSTWAKQWVSKDSSHRVRVNQDDIRSMLGTYWVPSRESLVKAIQNDIITEALTQGYDIVVDNTNMNKTTLEHYTQLCKKYEEYIIVYKDFFDTPLSVCIERDKNRDNPITEIVIRDFYNRYKNIFPLNGD